MKGIRDMKQEAATLIVIAVLLLLSVNGAHAAETGASAAPSEALLAVPDLGLYYSDSSLCGVTSLYYALSLLKDDASFADIAAAVDVDERGSTLRDMCSFLRTRGIAYSVPKQADLLSACAALSSGKRLAILHVDNGTHFVAVFKRPDGRLAILDGRTRTTRNVEAELRRRYSGNACIIGADSRRAYLVALMGPKVVVTVIAFVVGFALGTRVFHK